MLVKRNVFITTFETGMEKLELRNFHKSKELRFEDKTSVCFLEQDSSGFHLLCWTSKCTIFLRETTHVTSPLIKFQSFSNTHNFMRSQDFFIESGGIRWGYIFCWNQNAKPYFSMNEILVHFFIAKVLNLNSLLWIYFW